MFQRNVRSARADFGLREFITVRDEIRLIPADEGRIGDSKQDEHPAFDVTNSVRQVTGQLSGAECKAQSAMLERTSDAGGEW